MGRRRKIYVAYGLLNGVGMTTIVYKKGIIAYDSWGWEGTLRIHDDVDKHHIIGGVHFFCAGALPDFPIMTEAYLRRDRHAVGDAEAIAFDTDRLLYIGLDDKGDDCWWLPIAFNGIRAIGSGARHAYTAMDMGADAKLAVKMAAKRDGKTGGRIRTYRLKLPKANL